MTEIGKKKKHVKQLWVADILVSSAEPISENERGKMFMALELGLGDSALKTIDAVCGRVDSVCRSLRIRVKSRERLLELTHYFLEDAPA